MEQSLPIAVIIPVYNGLSDLPMAINSVQGQTALPLEIIVIDDGSTAGTAQEVLAGLTGPVPVRVLRQANAGVSAARNAGMDEASQPWLAFLDADDTWAPGKLAHQWEAIQNQPEAILVSTDWVRPGESLPNRRIPAGRLRPRAMEKLIWINQFQTSTVLVWREAIERAGCFRSSADGAEDWDAWIRTAAQGPFLHIAYPLVRYADTPTGLSKNLRKLYRNGTDMLEGFRRGEAGEKIRSLVTERVMVWHHLRFAFALERQGDQEMAEVAQVKAWTPGRYLLYIIVFLTNFLPFLLKRQLRRRRLAHPPVSVPLATKAE